MNDNGFIDKLFKKHRSRKSDLIPILQEIQTEYRYLPEDILLKVAKKINIPNAEIYGVATFYSQFNMKPLGEHIIRVCHGTACHVGGAGRITQSVEDLLQIKEKETTTDGRFTLEHVACLGCCSLAPVMMIDEKTYGRLKPNAIDDIIKDYKENTIESKNNRKGRQ